MTGLDRIVAEYQFRFNLLRNSNLSKTSWAYCPAGKLLGSPMAILFTLKSVDWRKSAMLEDFCGTIERRFLLLQGTGSSGVFEIELLSYKSELTAMKES